MMRLGALLRDHEGAIQADLTDRGINLWLDLDTERLPWPRLRDIVDRLGPGSALIRATDPDWAGWTREVDLLATLTNLWAAKNGAKSPVIDTPTAKAERRSKQASAIDGARRWKRRNAKRR